MRSFRVGAMECRVVEHGRGQGTPEWMFPAIPATALAAAMAPHLDAEGRFEFVYSSLVVRARERLVVIDSGLSPGPLLVALDARPDEVSTVVISHGHPDHVGGLTRSGRPTFPNARHVIAPAELEHWNRTSSEAGTALRVVEQAGQLEPVDGERDVVPGVRVLPAPGHTPGHLAVALSSQGERALYVGDALEHEVNVANPDWNHFSDMLPGLAARSRRRLVERAARDGAAIIASHLPEIGRVVAAAPGRHAFVAGR